MKCQKCGKSVNISAMFFHKAYSGFLCQSCYGKEIEYENNNGIPDEQETLKNLKDIFGFK